ncbi:MAG: DUF1116 domain-containing protein [Actinobacteria bacterium]|nr:DUF1116 domain-containing protein [Actinomycetota bacterium]
MSRLERLLTGEPRVATAGIDLLAEGVEAQGAAVTRTEWHPPLEGTEDALAAITAAVDLRAANEEAVGRLVGTHPHWTGMAVAREVMEMGERTFLHAGPPLQWDDCSGPMRGALVGAMLYEGLAATPEEAIALGPEIELSPCHHHRAVGPMAGVISPSMPVSVIEDAAGDGVSYATLNEGLGKVLRYGAFAPEVIERLKWIETVLGPVLADVLARGGPIDLRSIIGQALQMGDDGHNRNRAATSLLLRQLAPPLIGGEGPHRDEVFRFVEGNDHFMLNLVMAAGKIGVDAASGVPGSSMVTAMARNGTEFGIRLSGTGDAWFTAPAPVVDGLYLGAFTAEDANADIGDSAITETVGLGGFAMAASPAIVGFVGGTASGAVQRTLAMYEITLAEHPDYKVPILESRGTPTGIDAARVVRTGVLPVINTGIAGKEPGVGMVGAGIVEAPVACFTQAVQALAEEVARA